MQACILDLSGGGLKTDVLPDILRDGVGNVCLPVGIGANSTVDEGGPGLGSKSERIVAVGGNGLGKEAQPGQHTETSVLDLGNLHLVEVESLSKAQWVEVLTTWVVVANLEFGEGRVNQSAAVRLSETHGDNLKAQHVVEAGEA